MKLNEFLKGKVAEKGRLFELPSRFLTHFSANECVIHPNQLNESALRFKKTCFMNQVHIFSRYKICF